LQFSLMSLADDIKIVAVIQCAIALERCSGFHCSQAFYKRENYFKDYPDNVMYVPFSCGGCPGRRVSRLISNLAKGALKKEGIDKDSIIVHLTACIVTDNGHYPQCPFKDYMKAILLQKGFKVIDGGYESSGSKKRRENNRYQAYSILESKKVCL
jgi:predicted metal-binding protein